MDWVAVIDSAGVRYPRRKRSPDAQVMTAGVCPECGSDAESGHVVAIGPRIYWSTRGILGRALGYGGETLVRVVPTYRTADIEARRCVECRLVWFTY